MLVLSRKSSESIVFPSLDIRIEIIRARGNQVRIGIDAPRDVEVLRGELAAQQRHDVPKFSNSEATANSSALKAAALLNEINGLTESEQAVVGTRIQPLLERLQSLDMLRESQRSRFSDPKRAMIVDDNKNEANLLASYLRLKGFSVEMAHDGKDAILQLTQGQMPSIVLLDMNMPRFDGRWTITQIRRSHRMNSTKVYAISGVDQVGSGVEVGPRGVDEWFTKPLNPESLIDRINAEFESELTLN